MARNEEIAGISIGIGANTSALDTELSAIESRLNKLKSFTVVFDTKQLREQAAAAKRLLSDLSKTPVPIKFDFKPTRTAARDLATKVGIVPVDVSLRWNGKWEGGAPTGVVGVGGGGTGGAGGGAKPTVIVPARGAVGQGASKAAQVTSALQRAGVRGATTGVQAEAAVVSRVVAEAQRRTSIPANDAAGRRVQAQAGVSRGIYPAGTDISTLRAQIAENIGVSAGIGVAPTNPLYQRYIAAGGDPESLKIGIARPLPGSEAKYAAAFAKEAISRRQAKPEAAKPSGRHAMDFRASGIHRDALPLTPAQYQMEMQQSFNKDVDREFSKLEIKGSFAKVYNEAGEPTGESRPVYAGKRGDLIEGIRSELFESLIEPDLDTKIGKLSEAVKGLFAVGASQRKGLETLATARGKPGKGKSRFNKLVGQKGRAPTNISDYEIIDVRNMALAGSTELSRLLEIQRGEAGEDPGTLNAAIEQATAKFKAQPKQRAPVVRPTVSAEEKARIAKESKEAIAAREKAERESIAARPSISAPAKVELSDKDREALADRAKKRPQAAAPVGSSLVDAMKADDAKARAREQAGKREGETKAEFEARQGIKHRQTLLSGLEIGGPLEFAGGGGPAGEELARLQSIRRQEAKKRTAYARFAALSRYRGGEAAYGELTPAQQKILGKGALTRAKAAVSAPAMGEAAEAGKINLPSWPAGATVQFEDLTPQEKREAMMGALPARVLASVSKGGGGGKGGGGKKAPPPAGGSAEEEESKFKGRPSISKAQITKIIGSDTAAEIAAQFKTASREALESADDISQSGRAILEENPVRALSVAVSQIAVNIIGGRGKLKSDLQDLNKAVGLHKQSINDSSKAQSNLAQAEKARELAMEDKDEKSVEALDKQIPRLRKQADLAKDEEKLRGAEVQRLNKPIQAARGRLIAATLGVGTIGVVAGTQLFTAAMAAANLGLEQLGIGLGRVFERLSGFEQKTGQLTSQLADQARANSGNVEAAVASQFALSGLGAKTADTIRPLIEQRTAIVAGTKAFEEQVDFLHASQNIRGGLAQGIDVRGLTQTTGGFPIGQIGGQRSIRELIGNEFTDFGQKQRELQLQQNPLIDIGQFLGLQVPAGQFAIGGPDQAQQAKITEDLATNASDLNTYVELLNENVAKGDLTDLRYTLHPLAKDIIDLRKAAKEAADAYPDQADEINNFTTALESAGVAISGGVTGTGILQLLQSGAFGASKPTAQELFRAQRPQLEGFIKARTLQGQIERRETLPQQQFLGQLARPLVPFAQSVAARTPGASEAANYDAASKSIAMAQDTLKGYADQGQKAALNTIRLADALTGGDLEGEWKTATAAVASYGQKISQLQIAMQWKQVNLQVKQYDEQLRVANRSLADAKEFITGIKQGNSDGLGVLEHQSRELTKQATLLQQELAQRQINFQVAMAGFVAPGTTGEERAARVAQAKKEAEFAQKQLDLQKQQFTVAQQMVDINAGRSITDLTHQIGLLQEGRRVTIELAIDSENLAAMQQVLDAEMARAQSVLGEAVDIKNQIISVGASIVASIGGDIISFVNEGLKVLGVAGDYFSGYFARAYGNITSPTGGATGSGPGGAPSPYNLATGMLTNVSSATHLVVGEAGNETVAVLRNPKEMTLNGGGWGGGGGSGGISVQISVTGNTVRNEDDIEALAVAVGRKVEEALGRRASLRGLRPN